jgi:DNA processing protein
MSSKPWNCEVVVMSDALLRLAFCGLAPRRVDTLLATFGTVPNVLRAIDRGDANVSDHIISEAAVEAAVRRSKLAACGAVFVPRGSPRYPMRLDRFPGSPRWIFTIGDIPDRPSLAIVGTRACTAYGAELAEAYGATAAEAGWIVVSGLARGIDYAAHVGAATTGGTCVAILGSGIDVTYPREHAHLLSEIVDGGGAVVSEYPPGTRPDGWRFPTRNRIIAGCADAVVVVEAGETGGALITARIAVDYGIPVFAPPGDIDRSASVGTNQLIRDGAFPIFGADDLRQTLDLITPIVDMQV